LPRKTKAPAAGDTPAKPAKAPRGRATTTPPPPPAEAEPRDEDEGEGSSGEDEDAEPVADVVSELAEPEEEVALSDDEDTPVKDSDDDEPPKHEASSSLGRQDPLQAFLREAQKYPLLTPDEEHELAVKYATTQDVAAAARLVTSNLRLVVKIAYEYRRAYKNIMDLVQEGNIGLMQAVKKYDPHRGVKLSSYSAWWIRAYILRFIINNWRLVKLGTTQAQRKLFFNLNKEKARLSAMGIDPTPAAVAKSLGVEEQEASDMDRRLSSGEMSLDAPVGDTEGRPVSRIELMPSSNLGPDRSVMDGEMHDLLREKLAEFRTTLKGKDIAIFEKRLLAEEPLTLQELGDEFGISRERVRQIEARLTMNLRNYLRAELGDAVDMTS
jgi:RNA polymerase sigma-32 factor